MTRINWERVNKNLRCPICGDKAHIEGETNGTKGVHTHRFDITREMAEELSKPDKKERQELKEKAITMLEDAGVHSDLLQQIEKVQV